MVMVDANPSTVESSFVRPHWLDLASQVAQPGLAWLARSVNLASQDTARSVAWCWA